LLVPLDDDYDEIIIYYYTDAPNRHNPFALFVTEEYETPLYLCREMWVWHEGKYVRKKRYEELLDKQIARALVKFHLRFVVPTHEWNMHYKSFYDKYKDYIPTLYHRKVREYFNLGHGGRWNRTWEGSPYEDEDIPYGALY